MSKSSSVNVFKESFKNTIRDNATDLPPMKSDPATQKGKVVSFALYPEHIEKINQIVSFMFQNNCKTSVSKAIQMCISSAQINQSLITEFDRLASYDKRGKRK